jgi:hypothetical protein
VDIVVGKRCIHDKAGGTLRVKSFRQGLATSFSEVTVQPSILSLGLDTMSVDLNLLTFCDTGRQTTTSSRELVISGVQCGLQIMGRKMHYCKPIYYTALIFLFLLHTVSTLGYRL